MSPAVFSETAARRVQDTVKRYPDAQAACLPVLHIAQDEFGYLSDAAIQLVAQTLSLPEAHVFGVVTFYTMFHRHPAGKKALWVCTNISCMLRGGYEVLSAFEKKLGIKAGETTADGIHLAEEECLAACADAPMAICGPNYYLNIDPTKIDSIVAEVRAQPIQFGTLAGSGGHGGPAAASHVTQSMPTQTRNTTVMSAVIPLPNTPGAAKAAPPATPPSATAPGKQTIIGHISTVKIPDPSGNKSGQ